MLRGGERRAHCREESAGVVLHRRPQGMTSADIADDLHLPAGSGLGSDGPDQREFAGSADSPAVNHINRTDLLSLSVVDHSLDT